jgi:hypothetical protein
VDQTLLVQLILAAITGLPAIILAVATLVEVIRSRASIQDIGRAMNGRLDRLLVETEQRVRAEALAEVERLRAHAAAGLVAATRPEPIVRRMDDQGGH